MKLTFLGTGASEGIPAFRCGCEICREAREKKGKNIRLNSSLLVEAGEKSAILVDMPAHIMAAFEKYGIDERRISAILFSHFHIDHTAGIFHLLESHKKNGHVASGVINAYMPEDLLDEIIGGIFTGQAGFAGEEHKEFFSLNRLRHLEKDSSGEITFQALDTGHLSGKASGRPGKERECNGYLFSADGKRAACMVDSSPLLSDETLSALKGAAGEKLDCLVFECTFDSYPDSGRGHSDHEGVLRIRDLLRPSQMILTHISHRNFGHDKLSAFMERHGIRVAWDGLSVTV